MHHRIKKSVTKFWKPLEVGLKLSITPRQADNTKTYTSLLLVVSLASWLKHQSVNSSLSYVEPSLLNSRKTTALLILKTGKRWRSSEPDYISIMLQQKPTHKGRENSKLQDFQRQEGSGECVWNISEQIQGTTGHHGAKVKGCHSTTC